MHHNGSKVNKFKGIYSVWSKSGYDRSKNKRTNQDVDVKNDILFSFKLDVVKCMQSANSERSNATAIDDATTTVSGVESYVSSSG
jgi:hypothetical protein